MTKRWQAGDRIELDMSFDAKAADISEAGFIAGIASTPSTDSYGHKVLAKAFDKSIRKKGLSGPKGVKLLASHDWSKPAGVIKRLATVDDELEIEAQLNLNVSYVKDLYEVARQNEGLSFSVGFRLEEFSFVEGDAAKDGEWLVIKQGDLMEVSVVCFPACEDAVMTTIKQAETMAELEKALVAKGFCQSRGDAHKLARYIRANQHLLLDEPSPSAPVVGDPAHPMPDVTNHLKACSDLIANFKAKLAQPSIRT